MDTVMDEFPWKFLIFVRIWFYILIILFLEILGIVDGLLKRFLGHYFLILIDEL